MHRLTFLALAACAGRAHWSPPHADSGTAILCGPPDHPCLLARDEVVAHLGFTNDAPSIALDGEGHPAIVYSEATAGYHGYLARRGDHWKSDALPMVLASGLLAIAPDGEPRIVADDGAMHVSLWHGDDRGWHEEDTPGAHQAYSRATGGYDASGRLWTVLGSDDDHVSLALHDQAWTLTPVWTDAVPRPVLALGPGGQPQVVGWGTVGTRNGLFWSDGGAPEPVEQVGNVIMSQDMAFAIDGAGRPHLLYLREDGDGEQLVYATRGDAGWTSTVIATAHTAGTRGCKNPDKNGAACSWTRDELVPLAAVASGGEVRLLYTTMHEAGTSHAQCSFSEAGEHCDWDDTPSEHASALVVAWPDGDHLAVAPAAKDVELASATAVVGRDGAIHVAGYQWDRNNKPEVRYLVLADHGGGSDAR